MAGAQEPETQIPDLTDVSLDDLAQSGSPLGHAVALYRERLEGGVPRASFQGGI